MQGVLGVSFWGGRTDSMGYGFVVIYEIGLKFVIINTKKAMNYSCSCPNGHYSPFYFNPQSFPLMPFYPEINQFYSPTIEPPIENQFNLVYLNFPSYQNQVPPPQPYFQSQHSPRRPMDDIKEEVQQVYDIEEDESQKVKGDDRVQGPIFKRDRNIKSNAFKIFLKYARRDLCMNDGHHFQLIKALKLHDVYSLQQFRAEFEKALPESLNYIKVRDIHLLCLSQSKMHSPKFAKVFRISLKKFLRETVYLFNSKYTRTKHRVRREQIKACMSIYQEIFVSRKHPC